MRVQLLSMVGLVLLSSSAIVTTATITVNVDDWSANDITSFIKASVTRGHDITAKTCASAGIVPTNLFDGGITDATLIRAGVNEAELANVWVALQELDDRISQHPADIFEWRVANLMTCDYWLVPLAVLSPRALVHRGATVGSDEARILAWYSSGSDEGATDSTDTKSLQRQLTNLVLFVAPSFNLAMAALGCMLSSDTADTAAEGIGFAAMYMKTIPLAVFVLKAALEVVLLVWATALYGFAGVVGYIVTVQVVDFAGFLCAALTYHIGLAHMAVPTFAAAGFVLGVLLVVLFTANVASAVERLRDRAFHKERFARWTRTVVVKRQGGDGWLFRLVAFIISIFVDVILTSLEAASLLSTFVLGMVLLGAGAGIMVELIAVDIRPAIIDFNLYFVFCVVAPLATAALVAGLHTAAKSIFIDGSREKRE
jgi:hypothetical protein